MNTRQLPLGFSFLVTSAFSASAFGTGILIAVMAIRGDTPAGVAAVLCPIALALGLIGFRVLAQRWVHRLSASQLLILLQNDKAWLPSRTFLPMSLAMLVGGLVSLIWSRHAVGLVQTGAMFTSALVAIGWARQLARRQARIRFTLYAEGQLDPLLTARIDAEREHSPAFDAAVRSFQQWNAAVAELSAVAGETPPR